MPITINYPITLKLEQTIRAAGHHVWIENGVVKSSNDSAVQPIVDAYDTIPEYKSAKIAVIKAEGLSRINAVFPAIASVDDLEFISEFWASIKATSKQATVKFQKVIDIYSAAKTAITAVNAATTKAGIDAVSVSWPV